MCDSSEPSNPPTTASSNRRLTRLLPLFLRQSPHHPTQRQLTSASPSPCVVTHMPTTPAQPNGPQTYGPPTKVIKDLERLKNETANSASDLSSDLEELLELLRNGQETDANMEGLHALRKKMMIFARWAPKIKPADPEQSMYFDELRVCLSDAIDALTRESRQGEKCLVFFSKMEENEPCELFIDCLGAQITGLDLVVNPRKDSKFNQRYNFIMARIKGRENWATAIRPSEISIGSHNFGKQEHLYTAVRIADMGAIATSNDARDSWPQIALESRGGDRVEPLPVQPS